MLFSLIPHPKRHKDRVYTVPYNLISFSSNYNVRATFDCGCTCSPFCKPSRLAPSPQAARETDWCTEHGVKEKTRWKYGRDFPKCSHQAKHSRWKHLGQQWNRSCLCRKEGLAFSPRSLPAPLPPSAPSPLLLHRPHPFPLWNVSRGSPIFYFYSRFGSHWVSRKLCLPGCITNTFHALFSPSPFPPKLFYHLSTA